jgi:hypothetical protein
LEPHIDGPDYQRDAGHAEVEALRSRGCGRRSDPWGDRVHQAATLLLYAVHWVFEKKFIWAAMSGVQCANETCANRTSAARITSLKFLFLNSLLVADCPPLRKLFFDEVNVMCWNRLLFGKFRVSIRPSSHFVLVIVSVSSVYLFRCTRDAQASSICLASGWGKATLFSSI